MPKSIDHQLADVQNRIKKYQQKEKQLVARKIEFIIKKTQANKSDIIKQVNLGKPIQDIINTFVK